MNWKIAEFVIWSVAVILGPILIYWFVIRPRLKERFADTYSHIDSWWQRQWARVLAFRTYVIGALGIWLSEAPALLDGLNAVNLTDWPEGWQSTVRLVTIFLMIYTRARATTPVGDPPK